MELAFSGFHLPSEIARGTIKLLRVKTHYRGRAIDPAYLQRTEICPFQPKIDSDDTLVRSGT